MSELYFPQPLMDPDKLTQADIANWVYDELQAIAEVFAAEQVSKDFQVLSIEPLKFDEGTVVLFGQMAVGNVLGVTAPGLYLRRNGQWRRLVEES